ncbi:MAG TPA: sodium/proton-translocating pyrophosphatase, partial [Planctomycetia bacterium]|nr:sodium/proton-translocating pyrophosphatase [Planctomycetia bacterium]
LESYLFIGYLIAIAIFGLFQALFLANAGGAWDNAKKLVEVELKEKGTPLHDATVVGDTVGDPFKDTSSVAMNPVIKFTTLFGLLALEVAVEMDKHAVATAKALDAATTVTGSALRSWLFVICLAVALVGVWWSFYKMRIQEESA